MTVTSPSAHELSIEVGADTDVSFDNGESGSGQRDNNWRLADGDHWQPATDAYYRPRTRDERDLSR